MATGVIRRTVHNIDYAYFRDEDRREVLLGRWGEKETERKALVAERELLLKRVKSVQTKITEIDSTLKAYGEGLGFECHPFVKWAGGKTQLLGKMKSHFPEKFGRYWEPFLGGGAVFFYLASKRPAFPATLSDTNHDLINAYQMIRDDVEGLIGDLTRRKAEFDSQKTKADKNAYFLKIRGSPPDIDTEPIARAGWFIFLNKTAYNGLYRVNSNGGFNVPFGGYSRVAFFEADNVRNISTLLKRNGIKLVWADYTEVLKDAKEGDWAYLDPPYYSPDNKGFTAYNANLFTPEDQKKLADEFKRLTAKGVKVLLSNSKADFIEAEFKKRETKEMPLTYDTVEALRVINCKGSSRTGAKELLIKNY
ncbi:MAG TPA: Dam family site-specific DNA-(adenine-N6)-methyltransferase [Nitrososphaerales archaeon]|nr:Dam family site-specific DNA-(adenine-N6)-methyltransferase [Nitrososphaerales archaeon]